jgi:hypothetical protein
VRFVWLLALLLGVYVMVHLPWVPGWVLVGVGVLLLVFVLFVVSALVAVAFKDLWK